MKSDKNFYRCQTVKCNQHKVVNARHAWALVPFMQHKRVRAYELKWVLCVLMLLSDHPASTIYSLLFIFIIIIYYLLLLFNITFCYYCYKCSSINLCISLISSYLSNIMNISLISYVSVSTLGITLNYCNFFVPSFIILTKYRETDVKWWIVLIIKHALTGYSFVSFVISNHCPMFGKCIAPWTINCLKSERIKQNYIKKYEVKIKCRKFNF